MSFPRLKEDPLRNAACWFVLIAEKCSIVTGGFKPDNEWWMPDLPHWKEAVVLFLVRQPRRYIKNMGAFVRTHL